MEFNSIEEIIEDISQGKMVIMVDDEDRENEGDFLMAASKVKPEDINFMVTHGRGLVCLTLRAERCQQLNLPLMISDTDAAHGTNFTVSIEASEGVTTGISAYDRALTVRAAVAPDATPSDIEQPGHIFPLKAQAGGVLTRAGHTEAGCDLADLAGLEPAALIVEILNEDGSMARRDDLEIIAEKHDLKIGTVEALIRYRIQNEKTVKRVYENTLSTEFGEFNVIAFKDQSSKNTHLALTKGEISADKPIMVRVHIEDALCDVLPLTEQSCGWPLRDAMKHIADEGEGVIVILRETNQIDILARLEQLHQEPTEEESDSPQDLRTFGIGAQILMDVGVHKMRVMSAPKKFHGLAGFGLEVVEYLQD
ncbi:MAG: 3,4-dihydroxy-2-butanone-4-phosphate synthase [Aquificaceae bacterium]|nr:MAG: 3,4-dihydroxy-2-butanone-4-phosphate synthase [Aquificaceae bacterium]